MEKKIAPKFIDHGFGFPVVLLHAPMEKIRDIWTVAVNFAKLTPAVLRGLAFCPRRLTGAEVRFIRLTSRMTLSDFGRRFDATHAAVIKWENAGELSTAMNWATEKDIRLYILDFLKNGQKIPKLYKFLNKKLPEGIAPLEIDLQVGQSMAA